MGTSVAVVMGFWVYQAAAACWCDTGAVMECAVLMLLKLRLINQKYKAAKTNTFVLQHE
jgi:hypothetical protein